MSKAESGGMSFKWGAGAAFAAAPLTLIQPNGDNVAQTMTQQPPPRVSTSPENFAQQVAYIEKNTDLKLKVVEAQTETKFERLIGKIDSLAVSISSIEGKVVELKTDVGDVQKATAGVKWNIMATGLALGGLIFGMFSYGAQMIELASGLVGAGK